MHMRNCNSSRTCEVYGRTCACAWLHACLSRPHGAGRASPHEITAALALIGLGPRLRSGPCAGAGRSPDPECTRPLWVNGGPCPIKMLWWQPHNARLHLCTEVHPHISDFRCMHVHLESQGQA